MNVFDMYHDTFTLTEIHRKRISVPFSLWHVTNEYVHDIMRNVNSDFSIEKKMCLLCRNVRAAKTITKMSILCFGVQEVTWWIDSMIPLGREDGSNSTEVRKPSIKSMILCQTRSMLTTTCGRAKRGIRFSISARKRVFWRGLVSWDLSFHQYYHFWKWVS